jgi:hypothetical protein
MDIFDQLEEHVKKMRTGVVVIGLALVALAFACTSAGTVKPMQLGEALTLKIAESGKLATDDLTVTFKAVTSDSRCPQGTQCVTAGEADVVLTVKQGEKSQDVTVQVGAGAANKATVEPYAIRILKLDPYPVPDQPIKDADRVIELRVDRTGE